MGARRWSGAAVALVVAASPAGAAPDWRWPVDGASRATVSRAFDPPQVRWGSGHRGVDLTGAPGAPVRAAGPGTVSYAGVLAGRGVVVVTHGALRTTYEPVASLVPVGTAVAAGDVLGTLETGHAGCPVAACLHWGLKRGDDYLDPLSLLGAGPVRLLPLGGAAPPWSVPAAGAPAAPAEPAPSASPEPAPADVGPLDLRGATGPALLGLVALLALLGLRRRRPRSPDDPASAGAVAPPRPQRSGTASAGLDDRDADVLDLAAHRARRRAA